MRLGYSSPPYPLGLVRASVLLLYWVSCLVLEQPVAPMSAIYHSTLKLIIIAQTDNTQDERTEDLALVDLILSSQVLV